MKFLYLKNDANKTLVKVKHAKRTGTASQMSLCQCQCYVSSPAPVRVGPLHSDVHLCAPIPIPQNSRFGCF